MANILGLDTSKVYFHGVDTESGEWKLRNPSIKTPMYITNDYEEATTYCYDTDVETVYLVTLKDGTKSFNFSNGKQVDSLKGRTFYADDTIDLLRKCYGQIDDFNLWVWSHQSDMFIETVLGEMRTALQSVGKNYKLSWKIFEKESPFFRVMHHYSADSSIHKIRPIHTSECRQIMRMCRQHGFDSIHKAVFSKCEDSDNETTLMMKMYCDVMDAMATGNYGFDFMTFRRPLYKAIIKLGYPVVCDSNSTGRWADEYVVLSPEPIDMILNVPISDETERKYDVIRDLRNICKHENVLDKQTLYDLLETSKDKL